MARYTENQIVKIIEQRINPPCKDWYKSNLTAKSYCEVASREIIEVFKNNGGVLPDIEPDVSCTYNSGKRSSIRALLKDSLGNAAALDSYINKTNRREERMCHCIYAQQFAGEYEAIDYQVPTTNGGHDKIDLILKKGDTVYITETKYFGSSETLLRCVLEIQTYRQKLNDKFFEAYKIPEEKLVNAVLISDDTLAYRQLKTQWAQELMRAFKIKLLTLSHDGSAFYIS